MAKVRATGHTWQELEDQCTELAQVVNDALQRVIDRAVTRLSRGLTAAGESPDDVGGVAGDWDAEVRSTIAPYIVASYEGGALELAHNLVDQLELEPGQGIPGVSNALSEQYLSERRNLLRGVGDDLYDRMRTSLLEGMNAGESTEKLAQRVKDIGSFTQGRANAVARTEVLSASNRGSYDQAQLVLNDGDGKEWLATEDGRTRFDHAEADHQIVPVNASFVVGGYHMMHPGDDTAPAGEVVNCRCTIAYVFEDEMPPRNTCNGLGAVTAAVMNTGTCITKPEFHSSDIEVPPMTPAQERALYDDFKSRGAISPAYGGARIYKHLQDMQDQTLDEFQRLKVVDKVYAQDGGKSSFLDKFEEWAKSSVGKKTTGGLERGTYAKPVVEPKQVLERAPEPIKLEEPTTTTATTNVQALNHVEGNGHAQVERVLTEQSALIPNTLSNLQGIRKMSTDEARAFTAQYGKDALGGYTVERQDIAIHPQVMSDSYARQFAKESKNGFLSHTGHDHDAVESFVAHELGHHVDNMMRMATPQEVAQVWRTVGEALGLKPTSFSDRHSLDRWVAKNHDVIAKKISRYGAEDSAELLAEVWAEYTTNANARPYIKQIGEAMQSLAERTAPNRAEQGRKTIDVDVVDLDAKARLEKANSGMTAAVPYLSETTPDGDDDSDVDARDEMQHTGAMIALVPTQEDAERILVSGGEPIEELHLTLFFLGEVVNWPLSNQQAVLEAMQELTEGQPAVRANAFGVAVWNPDGDSPCVVMNIGGDEPANVRCAVEAALCDIWAACLPEQHSPWSPHVCLAYTDAPLPVITAATKNTGPITFDRLRVAFGGEVTDFPLYNAISIVAAGEGSTMTAPVETAAPTATGDVGGVGNTDLPDSLYGFDAETNWNGILVVEGVETGDGREFSAGSLTWANLPVPLMWQKVTSHGGSTDESVVVGRIDQIWRDPTNATVIRGAGVFDSGSIDGAEALRQVREQFLRGVSIDADSVKDSDVEYVFPDEAGDAPAEDSGGDDIMLLFGPPPDKMIFHAGRIRGATLVALPAFVEAQIQLGDVPAEFAAPMMPVPTGAPTASGTSASTWDEVTAAGRLASTMAFTTASQAFAYVDVKRVRSGAVHKTACRLLHHDIARDGSIGGPNLMACSVAIGHLLSDPKLGMSMAERRAAYEHLASHLRAAGREPQRFSYSSLSDSVVDAILASGDGYEAPPAKWFANPGFTKPTPLTVTEDGRIYGHAALWDSCHIGFDKCVQPPYEEYHSHFLLGEVLTAEGERVAVGGITLGTGHAPVFGATTQQALAHYDNTGSKVADIAVGNDDFGIWFAGAVKPGTPTGRIAELRAAKLSGDWRRVGHSLRLVALLAVNVPGFPVPRLSTRVSAGTQLALVASGIVPDDLVNRNDREALKAIKAGLAKRIGRDPKSRAAELRARVHRGG